MRRTRSSAKAVILPDVLHEIAEEHETLDPVERWENNRAFTRALQGARRDYPKEIGFDVSLLVERPREKRPSHRSRRR